MHGTYIKIKHIQIQLKILPRWNISN